MERRLPIRQVQDNPVYAGLVEAMDEAVGLVLKTLEEKGALDNTIIVFTSDNGGVASGDNFSTSNLPLRGGKGYQWEGGTREPFFIRVPGMNQVSRSEVPVIGTDFYPTLLELIGAKPKPEQHVDGRSLVPLLRGGKMAERPLYWHYPHYGNQGGDPSSVIRKGQWKLIHYWEDGTNELYDLEKDVEEKNNVAAQQPEMVNQLWSELEQWLESVGARLPRPDPRYDEELEKQRYERIRQEMLPQ